MSSAHTGAEKLILHIQKHSIPFALATSSGTEAYQAKTSAHRELFGAFHHMVLGDDPEVKASKPAPDIFLACARRFSGHLPGLHPQVLRTSSWPATGGSLLIPPLSTSAWCWRTRPTAWRSPRQRGCRWSWCPASSSTPNSTAGATLLLPSLGDIQPELFSLPAFN
ncbi:pseudouridine-5'-phosphatase-like isoform X1 [Dipodomys merriami]|uniref:pseudouridine-5'-phosphatase-like isoform X1 n=1 Tax=Dipodomys merriami TaxID=94247 RepID=UPI003855A19D